MLNKNVIKMMALCLSLFALLSASVVAQKQDDSLQLSGFNIPGVEIIVKKKPGGTMAAKTITDSSGIYSFTLAPGDYTMQVGSSDKPGSNGFTKITHQKSAALINTKTKWNEVRGSLFKFSIEGDGVTFGKATLLENSTSFKDEQGAVVLTIRNIQMDFSIKDKDVNEDATMKISGKDEGVNRDAKVKISGKVVFASKL